MSGYYSESDEEADHLESVREILHQEYLEGNLYKKKGKRYLKLTTGNGNLYKD